MSISKCKLSFFAIIIDHGEIMIFIFSTCCGGVLRPRPFPEQVQHRHLIL